MQTFLRDLGEWCTTHRAKLGFGILLALALKVYAGIAAAIDLGLADETFSLGYGLRVAQAGPPPAQSSPLYSVWYYVLSRIEPDPIRLYPLNWVILQLGLVVALYVLARRSGASLTATLLVATAWMLSHVIFVWPYVTYFSTLVLACAAIGATFVTDRLIGAAILSVALSAAVFVRPELWTPALLFACGVSGLATRRAIRSRRVQPIAIALGVAVVPAIGRLVFGDPASGVRGLFALGQHYALNRVEDGKLPLDPWGDWESLFRASFPRATTVAEAAAENPKALLWHVSRNVMHLPRHIAELAASEPYVPAAVGIVFTALLLATIVIGGVGLVRGRRSLPDGLVRWMPLAIVIALVAISSSILIYPRQHYLVPLCFFGLVFLAAGTHRRGPSSNRLGNLPPSAELFAPALLLVTLLAVPTYEPNFLPSVLRASSTPPSKTAKHTAETLRTLGVTGHVVILETTWSRGVYAGLEFDAVWYAEKTAPFWSFVHTRVIDIVAIDSLMRESPRFRDDPEFAEFLASPQHREDFDFFPVPGEDVVLAVRRRVMRGR